MSQPLKTWQVRDVIARIQADDLRVGFYMAWARTYAYVEAPEALDVLGKLPPDARVRVSIINCTVFVGGDEVVT